MAVINPFDFFVEPYAETLPFAYPAELQRELAAFLEPEPAGPLLQAVPASIPRHAAQHRRLPGRAQPAPAADDPLPDPHGAGRADAGGDAGVAAPARAATPPGCWCRSCAISAWRRASSPAT